MRQYLDNNATTPIHPYALRQMKDYMGKADLWGNPSSMHEIGGKARQTLDEAREFIADSIGAKRGEVYFTSGGTESNNMALWGVSTAFRSLSNEYDSDLIVSAIEHKSILETAERLNWRSDGGDCRGDAMQLIPVTKSGVVDLAALEALLGDLGGLVSVMHSNNETGVIQPIEEIAVILSDMDDIYLHVDACQSLGKVDFHVDELGADLMSLSAHKLNGPHGIGALYIREGTPFVPLMTGGKQEGECRPGTENLPGAVGFAAALRVRLSEMEYEQTEVGTIRNRVEKQILEEIPGSRVNGDGEERLYNTTSIGFEGVDAGALVLSLSNAGLYVSDGSACQGGRVGGSHVLKAMGLSDDQCSDSIRISFGSAIWETLGRLVSRSDVGEIVEVIKNEVGKARDLASVPF
jgi:cysteine desulfurase